MALTMSADDLTGGGGDALVLEDLPAQITLGLDTMSFSTSQSFPGFRDFPVGAHLVWVSSTDVSTARSGHWFTTAGSRNAQVGKVHRKRWDRQTETLVDVEAGDVDHGDATQQELLASLPLYQCDGIPRPAAAGQDIAPVPDFLSNGSIWKQLTFAVDADLLSRIFGLDQNAGPWPVSTADRVEGETRLREETELYAESSSQLHFTFAMDSQLINPSVEGAERTRQALDPTNWLLETLDSATADRYEREYGLVGELQFAFLTGMHLGNFSCLEQWWFLVNRLVFRAYDLVAQRPRLAESLIRTIHSQLVYNDRHLEGDILDMMPEEAKKLKRALITFKSRIAEGYGLANDPGERRVVSNDRDDAVKAFSSLESWLMTTVGWELQGDYVRSGKVMLEDGEEVEAELSDFEDEDERGDYAAVVVELDEHGRQADMVYLDR